MQDNESKVISMTAQKPIPVEELTPHQALQEVIASRQRIADLEYKSKQLGKQLGRSGATIYGLRNQVAGLRQALTISPGDYDRLLATARQQAQLIGTLQDKIKASEVVEPYHGKATA